MLKPPDADPVMPASVVTVIASLTSGLGIAFERVGDNQESRQRRDDGTEPVFRCRVHRRQQSPGDRRFRSFREIGADGPPCKNQNGDNTEHERAFDGPDACERRDVGRNRLAARRQRDVELLSVDGRDQRASAPCSQFRR